MDVKDTIIFFCLFMELILYSGNNLIILNTTLTDDLIEEGLAREIVSKVQNLRKEKDFEIENRIKLYYNGSEIIDRVFKNFRLSVLPTGQRSRRNNGGIVGRCKKSRRAGDR